MTLGCDGVSGCVLYMVTWRSSWWGREVHCWQLSAPIALWVWERRDHSTPDHRYTLKGEKKEEMEKEGIRDMVVQTDTQMWTDINLLVSVSHSVCTQVVMLSHSVLCPLTPLSCISWYLSYPYLLWWLSCWGWVQAIIVTITPCTFTDDYRTGRGKADDQSPQSAMVSTNFLAISYCPVQYSMTISGCSLQEQVADLERCMANAQRQI